MKKYGFILGLILVTCACSTTQQVVLHTLEPSPVALPNVITKIGIIDRSVPSKGHTVENQVDQYLAADDRWLSERGTNAAINGLFNALQKDSRFETVKLLDSVPPTMKDFGSSSELISWESVEALCQVYEVDAIFSLAYYDTDTKVSLKKTSVIQADLLRQKNKVKGQEITLETLIENGWRIYDPVGRQVIDEIVFNDQIVSKGTGVDPVQAFRDIADRREIILSKSRTTGNNYGLRLLPYKNSVSRTYYIRGTANFVKANELVIAGDWQAARVLWEQELDNADAKIKARGCHNLAVMNERDDDLEKALEWANKSLDHQNDKSTLAYLETLKKRIGQKELLKRQLAHNELSK